MSILRTIVDKKRERVSVARYRTSLVDLKRNCRDAEKPRDFQQAIRRGSSGLKLIAEIKKSSPSKGVIRADFDPVTIGSIYERKQVDAISVITEEDFFGGNVAYLESVRKIVTRPVLRKDFVIDEYQIYEARAHGADAVLLIGAILSPAQGEEYIHLIRELGMAALFEIHNFQELEIALKINAPIIGINNRNLKTMEIDINTSFALKRELPGDKVVVSESGISSREAFLLVQESGIDAVLIGTSFMASSDIEKKIDELRGVDRLS
jgi:indole-3-glycerol phosphate synthase